MTQTRTPTTLDDLDDLVADLDIEGRQREAAELLERMAEQLAQAAGSSLGTDVNRAELLSAAGRMWRQAEEPERAFAALDAADGDGSPLRVPVLTRRAEVFRSLGRDDDARAALAQLRPKDVRSAEGLLFTGELLEELGELNAAHRWYTRGVLLAERRGDYGFDAVMMLLARHRVRSELGLDHDEYDDMADEITAESRNRLGLE